MISIAAQSDTDAQGFYRNVSSAANDLLNSELVDQLRRIERIAELLPELTRVDFSHECREEIRRSQGLECNYCDKRIYDRRSLLHRRNMEVDHKIPISRGGRNNRWNLQALCNKCNERKSNKTDREYRRLYADLVTKPKEPTWDDWVNDLLDGEVEDLIPALLQLVRFIAKWSLILVARHPAVATVIAAIVAVVVAYLLYRLARDRVRGFVASATRQASDIAGNVRRLPGRVTGFVGRTRGRVVGSAGQLIESSRASLADRQRDIRGALESRVAAMPAVAWHIERDAKSVNAV